MLKSKGMLNTVKNSLLKIGSKRKDYIEFQEYLNKEFNYPLVEYMEYVIGARDVENLEPQYLFWLVKGINNFNNKIKIEDYFSEFEIRQYSNSKYEFETKSLYPLEIELKDELAEDQWLTSMTIDQIQELYNKQLIVYNPKTQRELKRKSRNGFVYYTIDIDTSSVKEIKDLMLKKKFISNALTFNFNLEDSNMNFDIKNNKLILYSGRMDIIDGFHRLKAALTAKLENPDFEIKFPVYLTNFDDAKACDYIAQEDKRNKISIDYRKSLDSTNVTNIIVDRINTAASSLIRGLIGKEGISVISRTEMFWAIDNLYDTNTMTRSELLRTANYITNVINFVVEEKIELMEQMDFIDIVTIIYGTTISDNEQDCAEAVIKALDKKKSAFKGASRINKKKIISAVAELFQ